MLRVLSARGRIYDDARRGDLRTILVADELHSLDVDMGGFALKAREVSSWFMVRDLVPPALVECTLLIDGARQRRHCVGRVHAGTVRFECEEEPWFFLEVALAVRAKRARLARVAPLAQGVP